MSDHKAILSPNCPVCGADCIQVLYRRGHEDHTGHAVGGGPVERSITIYTVTEDFACGMRRTKTTRGGGFGAWAYWSENQCANAQDVALRQKGDAS